MDLTARVKRIFEDSVDTTLQSVEVLAPTVVSAANRITSCLINERKIMACGNGASAASAQHFCTLSLNRFEIERPGLPAIPLNLDAATISGIARDNQFTDIYSKQIRALGQPGDMLLLFTTTGRGRNLREAVKAARDRDMSTIALTGGDGGELTQDLKEIDIEIRVPSLAVGRILEVHYLIIHCICDLVDHLLLGQDSQNYEPLP